MKDLEPPYHPPLARMARSRGIIEMKLKIGADSTVLSGRICTHRLLKYGAYSTER